MLNQYMIILFYFCSMGDCILINGIVPSYFVCAFLQILFSFVFTSIKSIFGFLSKKFSYIRIRGIKEALKVHCIELKYTQNMDPQAKIFTPYFKE